MIILPEEPNYQYMDGPTVNGFAGARRRFLATENPNFSKVLARFLAALPFSVQEIGCLCPVVNSQAGAWRRDGAKGWKTGLLRCEPPQLSPDSRRPGWRPRLAAIYCRAARQRHPQRPAPLHQRDRRQALVLRP